MSSPDLLFALTVSVGFYGVFYGRFKEAASLMLAAEAAVIGITLSILLMLTGPFVRESLLTDSNPLTEGFFLAAVPEKTGTLIAMWYLGIGMRGRENLTKSAVTGMIIGAGFSFFENLSYSSMYSPGIIYVRLLSSVPMHLTTSGLLGYFYGLFQLSQKKRRYTYLFTGLFISTLIHGLFDYSILSAGTNSYMVGPLVVISVFLFEAAFSKSQTIPSSSELSGRNLALEEWMLLNRQRRYEKWIRQSAGNDMAYVPFFSFQRNPLRWLIVALTAGFGITHLTGLQEFSAQWFDIHLDHVIFKSIFGMMPIAFAGVVSLVGSVNPAYFQAKLLKIPVLLNIEAILQDGRTAKFVCYEMIRSAAFIKAKSLRQGIKEVTFSYANKFSPPVTVDTTELNSESTGLVLLRFRESPPGFRKFYQMYTASRLIWGFFFNLRLPGFDSFKKFFVHPLTLMQEERHYKAGDIIFQEGDEATHFFLIQKGSVDFFKENSENSNHNGNRLFLSNLGPGNIFGEMALVSDRPRSATAICREDCDLSIARTDQLELLVQYNPEFTMKIIRMLVSRIINSEQTFKNELARLE